MDIHSHPLQVKPTDFGVNKFVDTWHRSNPTVGCNISKKYPLFLFNIELWNAMDLFSCRYPRRPFLYNSTLAVVIFRHNPYLPRSFELLEIAPPHQRTWRQEPGVLRSCGVQFTTNNANNYAGSMIVGGRWFRMGNVTMRRVFICKQLGDILL